MKKTMTTVWLFTTIYFLLTPISMQAVEFAGGTGVMNDPYRIATAEQLIGLGEDPNLFDKRFTLVADIDLDPNLPGRRVFYDAVIGRGSNMAERQAGLSFQGTFSGNGYVIRNLVIKAKERDDLGFFASVADGAGIHGLGLENICIRGRSRVGGLVGYNNGHVWNCYTTGTVMAADEVGGLIGVNGDSHWLYVEKTSLQSQSKTRMVRPDPPPTTVERCYSRCSVTAKRSAGGLVGKNQSSLIRASYATGTVRAERGAGGAWVTIAGRLLPVMRKVV